MLNYLLGALIGGCMGLVAVFFAYGGLRQRKLFARLLKRKGRWYRSFAVICAVSTAIGIYAIWLFESPNRQFWALMLLTCYLLAVSVTDLRRQYIPDDCTLFFAVVFALFRLSAMSVGDVLTALLGAGVGMILLGLPYLVRPGAVGLGDIKLLAACGLMAGFPGVIYLLVRAMLAMFVISLVKLILKKTSVSEQMPMAPFVLFAALI